MLQPLQPRRVFIVFPNQLYADLQPIQSAKCDHVLLVEEPVYFYDKLYKPIKPHKMKIAFLRACMQAYYDLQLCKKFTGKSHTATVSYIDYSTLKKSTYASLLAQFDQVVMYDPIDAELVTKMQDVCAKNGKTLETLDSPDLLLGRNTLAKYYAKHGNSPKHASFYEFVKIELDVLKSIKNLDKENRSPPPSNEPNVYRYKTKVTLQGYYTEAIKYTNENFSDHHGQCEQLHIYPISHAESVKALNNFFARSLMNFGKYEDAIMEKDPFMYHSIISPMLNVGLLTSKQVLHATLQYYNKHKLQIPLSSLEGFLRQVIGWRSFMQSLYIFKGPQQLMMNSPGNNKKFKDPTSWYKGTTGIKPLDEEIKKVTTYGYAHHIVRLMMFMNFFILCELHPYEIYKWFMEVVSIDAYSWVMISNIYAMGYFHPRIMGKPYISTSNYIVKMTNYRKDGHWDKIWDALYHDFLRAKPSSYTFFYKRTYRGNAELLKLATDFKEKHLVDYTQ